jgi:hypothetical protein
VNLSLLLNWDALIKTYVYLTWYEVSQAAYVVLGDLFDMLLPMLGIYQEYVRNHHYSLQVLAEYKQKVEFNQLLRRYEEKTVCEGHSLENYLTYPMHQVRIYVMQNLCTTNTMNPTFIPVT